VSCFEFELVNGPETNGREGSFDLWKIGAHSYMTCKGGATDSWPQRQEVA